MSLRNRKMVPYRGTGMTEQVILCYSKNPLSWVIRKLTISRLHLLHDKIPVLCYQHGYQPDNIVDRNFFHHNQVDTHICNRSQDQYTFHFGRDYADNHLKVIKSQKKNWNSQLFQKTNKTQERLVLRALRIVFSSLSFIFWKN